MKADATFEALTAKIIDKLEHVSENGWRLPWHFNGEATVFSPVNAVTRQPYRGANVLALWIEAEDNAYESGWWATYKQWTALGAQVRKGEKGTACIKWASKRRKDEETGERTGKAFLVPFGFTVFNAAQVDGWEQPEVEAGPEPVAHAEAFFGAIGAKVLTEPNAFYQPAADYIGVPPLDSFKDAVRYYSVLAHEHTHWTGHKSRLNRDLTGRFGDQSYAAEELVAELGAAFVCAHLGLDNEPREDHAQYVKNWLAVLRDDPKAVWKAASLAQAAATYLTEKAGDVPATTEQAA